MGAEAELREWLDRLAIQDLIHRYSDAVTRSDYDRMMAVFAHRTQPGEPAHGHAVRERP